MECWELRKTKKNAEKQRIQKEFREKLGLIIDMPKQNPGNSNYGNTARRFFADYAISSQVTGVSEELISRFGVILQTLASSRNINPRNC
jgi:hypothetical protein